MDQVKYLRKSQLSNFYNLLYNILYILCEKDYTARQKLLINSFQYKQH